MVALADPKVLALMFVAGLILLIACANLAGLTLVRMLPNDAAIRLLASFTYTAEMFNDSLNTPELRRPPTRALDGSIHYVAPGGLYDLAVGGTNLTNQRYFTAGATNYGAGVGQVLLEHVH